MPTLNEGDMVLFDYDLLLDGVLKETSDEAKAKAHNLKRRNIDPVLITFGQGQLVLGLEEHMRANAEVGTTSVVVVPPEMAFGVRNKDNLHIVPIVKFGTTKPVIGLQVNMGNRPGIVTKVGGGRVTVDTHHEYAGRNVEYAYTPRGIYKEPKEKISALLRKALGDAVIHGWTEDGTTLTVHTPDKAIHNPQWAGGRPRIVQQLRHAADGQRISIIFVEAYPPLPLPPPVTIVPDPVAETPAKAS